MCGILWSLTHRADGHDDGASSHDLELLRHRGPDAQSTLSIPIDADWTLTCHCSVLSLRGGEGVTQQPLHESSSSTTASRRWTMAWNGELFGGPVLVDPAANDGQQVLEAIARGSAPLVVAQLRGPWAMALWDRQHGRLWFGRDCLGRRSLLWRRRGRSMVLASVSAGAVPVAGSTAEEEDQDERDNDGEAQGKELQLQPTEQWQEVPACGLFYVDVIDSPQGPLVCRCVPWSFTAGPSSPSAESMPYPFGDVNLSSTATGDEIDRTAALDAFEVLLSEAVRRRVVLQRANCPVAVLFSGGLDSVTLAALVDRHAPAHEPIELLNVAFGSSSSTTSFDVPDRQTARVALGELRAIAPGRDWRLVEVNVTAEEVQLAREHVRTLIAPCGTVLDLSIGTALWFAARLCNDSKVRVVFSGIGADEQLAGYSRHWARFKTGGWDALAREVQLDVRRISSRNMGRDDRVVSDHGRELRAPFLDEDVVRFLSELPVWVKADLRLARGVGDKILLRQLAGRLGLHRSGAFPKRAIQFGSRVAKIDGMGKKGKGSDVL